MIKSSSNDLKDPYMRNDLWVEGRAGEFGFLWVKNRYNPNMLKRLDKIVARAKKELKTHVLKSNKKK